MGLHHLKLFALLQVAILCQVFPWVKPDSLNKGLPASVEIYTLNTSSSPFSSKLTGGFIRFDMRDSNLEFKVRHTEYGTKPKTPAQYASQEPNLVYAVINGGYFDMVNNISASFIAENGNISHKNTVNSGSNAHPTVGAFGLKNKKFTAEYVYSYDPISESYRFNSANPVPGPQPNKTAGELWKPQEAMGAGPIVVKAGFHVTGNPQNFNMNNMINFRHPRSAICLDKYSRLLFVAIDGRYDGSDGLTMPELADMMVSLECEDAMNLDGGGSTCLFANNVIINKPSDATGPRPVVSAIVLRDRYKPKTQHLREQ